MVARPSVTAVAAKFAGWQRHAGHRFLAAASLLGTQARCSAGPGAVPSLSKFGRPAARAGFPPSRLGDRQRHRPTGVVTSERPPGVNRPARTQRQRIQPTWMRGARGVRRCRAVLVASRAHQDASRREKKRLSLPPS